MKTLDLYLTKICNLDCDYCYVDIVKKENTEFPVDDFIERVNLLDYDDIKFFWWEPLVKWKLIQKIVLSVQKHDKKPRFTIVTNGILLTKQKTDFAEEYDVNLIISIHEGSFGPLKNKIPILLEVKDRVWFYIIFDPDNLQISLRNFLLFSQSWFSNFNFAPEIYSNWDEENLSKLEKTLEILTPYIKKNKIKLSGIDRSQLKIPNRGCEKTVYDEHWKFSPCNRFNSLKGKDSFTYNDTYTSFDKEINFSHDPLRWFYICPVWWFLDHEWEGVELSIQRFKSLNHIFIDFFRKIYDENYSFLTPDLDEIRFNLTEQCNLRCEYCYVDFKDKVLNERVWKNIIDFFLEQEGTHKKISFFWWEPMLEFVLLENLVEYANKKSQDLWKTVQYTIATNFTLVTEKKVNFLKQHNFSIHISLNGDTISNDQMRDNSSKLVLANIEKYFSQTEIEKLCILFAFSPQNVNHIPKNLEFLIQKGMKLFNLELIYWKNYIWSKDLVIQALSHFKTVKKKYTQISYQNEHKESKYIDINTDGICAENSLEFFGDGVNSKAKTLFDRML